MALRVTCGDCGYAGTYKTQARADFAHPRHSCKREKERQAKVRRVRARRANRGGEVRGCQHKYANHQHGTYAAFVLDECRCVPCLDANAAYERNRTRLKLYGQWTHRVDAGPTRQRMIELAESGVSYKQVAKLTGLKLTTLGTLIYGRHDRRNGAPPKTVSAEMAEKILSLVPDPMDLSKGSRIDPTGSRRRLQALVALGWSQRRLSERLGFTDQDVSLMLRERTARRFVSAGRARAIRDLYEELWDEIPTGSSPSELRGITMAKRVAAERNWLPPIAWPDDSIDDPNFDPAAEDELVEIDEIAVDLAVGGHRVLLTKQERVAATARLTKSGLSAKEIAARLATTSRAIQRDRAETRRNSA